MKLLESSSSPHAEVTLGKMLKPRIAPDSSAFGAQVWDSVYRSCVSLLMSRSLAWLTAFSVCECEWVNAACAVKCSEWSVDQKRAINCSQKTFNSYVPNFETNSVISSKEQHGPFSVSSFCKNFLLIYKFFEV